MEKRCEICGGDCGHCRGGLSVPEWLAIAACLLLAAALTWLYLAGVICKGCVG